MCVGLFDTGIGIEARAVDERRYCLRESDNLRDAPLLFAPRPSRGEHVGALEANLHLRLRWTGTADVGHLMWRFHTPF